MAIDSMIQDTLVLSNKYFDFLHAIHDPSEYIKLDDNILYTIENLEDDDIDLKRAQKIISRIRNRDLYSFIGELVVDNMDVNKAYMDFLTIDNPNNFVRREDIEIRLFSLDFGFGAKNPLDTTFFYDPEDLSRCLSLSEINTTIKNPEVFQEFYLRVYCKDKSKVDAVNTMFEKYKKMLKNITNENTPIKKNAKLLSYKRERESEKKQ